MVLKTHSAADRIARALSSLRTGIVLLILVGVAAAAGTLILQRPLTDPEVLERAYSPQTLRWLDALGMTDVFHSWWFAGLLALLGVNLVWTSLERLPVAWRYIVRPYRRPEPHFLAGLPMRQEIPIRNAQSGVEAAERAFRRVGLKPQRIGKETDVSLFAERHRYARLAAYVVHASLLLIFAGGVVDLIWGYRGFVALVRGQQTNQIELRSGGKKTLPFTIRCDGAGQENYPDGSPRRWWSQVAILEGGREVKRQEIAVNEPLVHRGLRFFQSSYGSSGQVENLQLAASPKAAPGDSRQVLLLPGETVPLDAKTTVSLAKVVPDFVVVNNQIETRSDQPNNPAIELRVNSKDAGESAVWLFSRYPDFTLSESSPYAFRLQELKMAYFTGLQVSHEPGQWAVWGGCLLMGLGLALAFYFVPMRFWAVPVSDGRGRLVLWVGASASKNRDEFEDRFRRLVEEIQKNLEAGSQSRATARVSLAIT